MAYTMLDATRDGWHGHKAESFVKWRNEVDREVKAIFGMGIDDLPDYRYADAFESGEDPTDVAEAVMSFAFGEDWRELY